MTTPARRLTHALAMAALLLSACGGGSGTTAATVGGEAIPVARIEQIVTAQLASAGIDPESLPADQRAEEVGQRQRSVLSSLIRIEVVRQLAESRGATVTEAEIDEQLDLAKQLQGGDEAFAQVLEQTGLTEQEYRDLVVTDLARQVAIGEDLAGEDALSGERLRAAYDEQILSYTDATLRHILVETEEEAQAVLVELEGGAVFAELARERSTDGSAEQGGDLGTQPLSGYVPEFAQAVADAQPGAVVGPVQTQFGWHVIEVVDVTLRPFDEVRSQVRQQAIGTEVGEELNALLRSSFEDTPVEVSSRFGVWDPDQLLVVASDELAPDGSGTSAPGVGTPPAVPSGSPTGNPSPTPS